eukprot:409727_1
MSGRWNDIRCRDQRVAICERPRVHFVGHYIAVMRKLDFKRANKRCQELFSTDLATIENARENILVRRACSALDAEAECWIGLQRPFNSWNDGEMLEVDNWAEGEPNGASNAACTIMKPTQRWADDDCNEDHFFVCNTITHEHRVKRRAEQQRKQEEHEAALEEKKK